MKYIKEYNNEGSMEEKWNEIIESKDVYQLYDVLVFKYGKDALKDTEKAIEEEEGDYNPDHIYDIIKYEMEQLNIFNDFVNNYEKYVIEMEENDPFHWRYKKKQMDDLGLNWD